MSPRRGIERKILVSILWVGILPMVLVLAAGFFTARTLERQATQNELSLAAERTVTALRLAAGIQLEAVEILARSRAVLEALSPTESGRPAAVETPGAREEAIERLRRAVPATDPWRALALYDARGRPVLSTADNPDLLRPHLDWPESIVTAELLPMDSLGNVPGYVVQAVAPVLRPRDGVPIGYLAEVYSMNPLLERAFRGSSQAGLGRHPQFRYQFVYDQDGAMVTSSLTEQGGSQQLVRGSLDTRLAALLRGSMESGSAALDLRAYQTHAGLENAILAYHRLLDGHQAFVVVYVPALAAYRTLHVGGGLLVLVWGTVIAFVSFYAYRNVNRNISTPIALLNEGAQIIGQGDLDLKLKIRTGDEIEELATSFNQMAVALKRTIRRTEESEERYRSLVTSMRDGLFQAGPDGDLQFFNPAAVQVFRYVNMTELIGLNIRDLFLNSRDYGTLRRDLKEQGYVERWRVWMKRKDGHAICVELSANPVLDDAGLPVGMEGIVRDVTRNVRLEYEARDRAERLTAVNQIANVINSSLEAGRLYESLAVEIKRLVDFDYAALALLDERGEQFYTLPLFPEAGPGVPAVYGANDCRYCAARVLEMQDSLVVDDLRIASEDFVGPFPEGIRSCLSAPLFATGRVVGSLNLGASRPSAFSRHDVDVLEQMAAHIAVAIRNAQLLENLQRSLDEVIQAREQLRAANEELKTLDEMKTNLLSNVSHELRTPLVSVLGYNDMILNGKAGPITPDQEEYLSISIRNIERLVTLIENLLDFSRMHRGLERLSNDTFDLVECARGALQLVRPSAEAAGVTLRLDAPEEPVYVDGDKGKLGQVFNNLLSNAIKFNQEGGSVTVALVPHASDVEVLVTDTGIGIPEEALGKIFTRFYQVDSSSTRKYGGTGIGLAIAQDIVRLHGSRITVTSVQNQGSTFRFAMPLAGAGRASAAPPVTETRLLVEFVTEDRGLGAQVREFLDGEGMNLIQAATGEHAVDLAQRYRPDCFVVDLGERGSGCTALDAILAAADTGPAPIVIMTNDDALAQRYRALTAARLKRGFRRASLLSAIRNAFEGELAADHAVGPGILCADDDEEVLTLMRRVLESEGYTVTTCSNGDDALDLATSREYGVVLLDIAMPGLDGWECCRQIKARPDLAGVKVCMVTAKPLEKDLVGGPPAEADGFLQKPFKHQELLDLVQNVESPRVH